MELANCLLALGGDRNNTVPKYDVTPGEIAVMRAIHSEDAVFDIEPTGRSTNRPSPAERERLLAKYPALNESRKPIVLDVYPGVAPVLHQTIADLGLDESLFKPVSRAKPAAPPEAPAPKKGRGEKTEAAVEEAPPVPADADDATGLFDDDDTSNVMD